MINIPKKRRYHIGIIKKKIKSFVEATKVFTLRKIEFRQFTAKINLHFLEIVYF